MPVSTTQRITPFLWFDANAEEAANFYVTVFPNSRVREVSRFPSGLPLPEGTVMTVTFELDGVGLTAMNGGPGVVFNQSVSFVVLCETQAEVDRYWERLTSGGGEAVQCGWLRDRFGLSWQVVPSCLPELMRGPRRAEVMAALCQMVKVDIAVLQAAAGVV